MAARLGSIVELGLGCGDGAPLLGQSDRQTQAQLLLWEHLAACLLVLKARIHALQGRLVSSLWIGLAGYPAEREARRRGDAQSEQRLRNLAHSYPPLI